MSEVDQLECAEYLIQKARGQINQTWYAWEIWGSKGILGKDNQWRYPFIQGVKTLLLRPVHLLVTIRRSEPKLRFQESDIQYPVEYNVVVEDVLGVSGCRYLVKVMDINGDNPYFEALALAFGEILPNANRFDNIGKRKYAKAGALKFIMLNA